MSFEFIQQTYRVPARLGGRVAYTGSGNEQLGTITGCDGAHLCIKLDDDTRPRRFHPTWELRFLPMTQIQKGGAA
jgi:hypothetical protein